MTTQSTTVLIAGAGPIGILAGLLLHRHGIDFRIVERRSGLHEAPQAHVISSRSLEICRSLGIDDAPIREAGPRIEDAGSVRWVDRLVGRDLGVFDLAADPASVERMLTQSPTPTTNLSQEKFERVLYDALVDRVGSDRITFDTAWEGFTEADGAYLSRIVGPSGEQEISSKYLLGADGAGSRVRKALGIAMEGPDNLQAFVTVHFSANMREHLKGREGLLYWVMDEQVAGVFIAHDIEGDWIYMKEVDAAELDGPIDEPRFAALLADALGADVPHEIHSMNGWRMTSQIASAYRQGNAFIIGDAAHRFPPTGGIGMNTGFQDAHNLTWKIAMVERGMTPSILDTYERERRAVAITNAEQSVHNAMKMFEVAALLDVDGDQRISAADIDEVLNDDARMADVQAAIDAQAAHFDMSGLDLGVCYSGPGVMHDGPPPESEDPVSIYVPSTTPGARLPHVRLEQSGQAHSSLDLVEHDHFVVLCNPELEEATHAEVQTLAGAGIPITARSTALPEPFAADEVLLLRPDGHIAARARSSDAATVIGDAMRKLWGG